MASGVFRPYTLPDILGSITDSVDSLTSVDSTSAGTGYFTEADETLGITDSATVTAVLNPAWGSGQWSAFSWG